MDGVVPGSRSSTSDQTLERQNDEELNSLHGKIKALRSVRGGLLPYQRRTTGRDH